MKRMIVFLSLLSAISMQFVSAQDEKLRVAVFDPSSSGTAIDEGTRMAVREIVSSTFVNTGKYIIVERSLLDKVMKELEFSNTGVVDDSQATEFGRLTGANKVVLSVVTLVGGRNMLSIKVIDVKTATVDQQKTKIVGSNDLLDVIEPLTLELIGIEKAAETASRRFSLFPKAEKTAVTVAQPAPQPAPVQPAPVQRENTVLPPAEMSSSGGNVFLEFKGFAYKKNPAASIFVDGVRIGNGSLNQGFSVYFTDMRSGTHQIKIEWSDMITAKTYNIDTAMKQHFIFEYIKGGFGYELRLKN